MVSTRRIHTLFGRDAVPAVHPSIRPFPPRYVLTNPPFFGKHSFLGRTPCSGHSSRSSSGSSLPSSSGPSHGASSSTSHPTASTRSSATSSARTVDPQPPSSISMSLVSSSPPSSSHSPTNRLSTSDVASSSTQSPSATPRFLQSLSAARTWPRLPTRKRARRRMVVKRRKMEVSTSPVSRPVLGSYVLTLRGCTGLAGLFGRT